MGMEVKTIAVIGAGTMGRGIAVRLRIAGYRTILEDISEARLEQAVADWESPREGVREEKVDPVDHLAAMKHLATASKVENAIREAELIIEAVPERNGNEAGTLHHLRQIRESRCPLCEQHFFAFHHRDQ